MTMRDEMRCPHCGDECARDDVDVGIGIMYGPWGCPNCGWSEDEKYDSREGIRRDGDGRVLDQYGGSCHVSRPDGEAILLGLNVSDRGAVGS